MKLASKYLLFLRWIRFASILILGFSLLDSCKSDDTPKNEIAETVSDSIGFAGNLVFDAEDNLYMGPYDSRNASIFEMKKGSNQFSVIAGEGADGFTGDWDNTLVLNSFVVDSIKDIYCSLLGTPGFPVYRVNFSTKSIEPLDVLGKYTLALKGTHLFLAQNSWRTDYSGSGNEQILDYNLITHHKDIIKTSPYMQIGERIEIDPINNLYWVFSSIYSARTPCIMRFNLITSILDTLTYLPVLPLPDPLYSGGSIILKFDKMQILYFTLENHILRYRMDTKQFSQLNVELFGPYGLAFDSEGSLYYSELGPVQGTYPSNYYYKGRLRKIKAPIRDSYFTVLH